MTLVECRVPELRATVRGLALGFDHVMAPGAPPFVVDRDAAGDLVLTRGGARLHAGPDPGRLLANLEVALDAEAPRLLAGRCAFHAAAAAGPEGAVLVAGASWAGKSTLATALVARGLAYLTDDTALVDDEGRVLPFPRRIGLRPGTLALVEAPPDRFERVGYDLDDHPPIEYLVPLATADAPTPVRVLAFLERAGAALACRDLSAAEATARLVAHALQRDDPARDLRRASRVVAGAPARLLVTGGGPGELARALLARLAGTMAP
ncbi:MAG: hypothetical protein KF878_21180 [Planctomycetes bacterium]|nr:hypothetical protein [Planctomycetota bacterium]